MAPVTHILLPTAIEESHDIYIMHLCARTEAALDIKRQIRLCFVQRMHALVAPHGVAHVAYDHKDALTVILLSEFIDFLCLEKLVN